MRSHARTIVVLAIALALIALFLYNVNLWGVLSAIVRARPVWLALSAVSDWRWLRDREDTPWYPMMRLFRQKQLGDWDDVFERMAGALGMLAGHGKTCIP